MVSADSEASHPWLGSSWRAPSQPTYRDACAALFGSARKGGIYTHLAPWGRDWNPRAEVMEAARAAARRGLHIRRVLMAPDARRAHSPQVRTQVALDVAAGIEVEVLDLGPLMGADLELAPEALAFGIWDDAVCAVPDPEGGRETGETTAWRFTDDRSRIDACLDTLRTLRRRAHVVPRDAESDARPEMLPEPLAASAELARVAAPQLCLPACDGRPACAPYHGLYPLLRVRGLAATAERHAAFYARELGALAARGGYERVLVSGTADHGMPAQVLRAYRSRGVEPELHVLDICPTPALLCQSYAHWVGARILTHTADIRDWRAPARFDVVTTHSFIVKFPPEEHKSLFASWRAALREGGRLITTTRIDPNATPDTAGFSAEQAEGFWRGLRDAVGPWRDLLGIDPDALRDLALAHCADVRSFAVRSEEALVCGLESAGFEIERLDRIVRPGRFGSADGGAGTNRTASYADFVAVAR